MEKNKVTETNYKDGDIELHITITGQSAKDFEAAGVKDIVETFLPDHFFTKREDIKQVHFIKTKIDENGDPLPIVIYDGKYAGYYRDSPENTTVKIDPPMQKSE